MTNFHPLEEWLNTLPKPETFYEKLLCLWSDIVDDLLILKAKIKRRKYEKRK